MAVLQKRSQRFAERAERKPDLITTGGGGGAGFRGHEASRKRTIGGYKVSGRSEGPVRGGGGGGRFGGRIRQGSGTGCVFLGGGGGWGGGGGFGGGRGV